MYYFGMPEVFPPNYNPGADLISLRKQLAAEGITQLRDVRIIEYLITKERLPVISLIPFIEDAKQRGRTPAEAAQDRDMLSLEEILEIDASIAGWKVIDLNRTTIEDSITSLISADQAVDWQVLPFSRDELGRLLVAVSGTDNTSGRENMQRFLPDEEIYWLLTDKNIFDRFIEVIYDPKRAAAVSEMITATVGQEDTENENFTVRDSQIESPVIRLVDDLIAQAGEIGASDIHIEPQDNETVVRFRIDGILRKMTTFPRRRHNQVLARIKNIASMRTDEQRLPQDGRISVAPRGRAYDLRIVTMPTIHGEQCTMRILDPKQAMLSLEELGMSHDNLVRFNEAISLPYGCAIITGPTGSGKSTTLYSAISRVASNDKKIVTIEDPVEYQMNGISQTDVSRSALAANEQRRLTFAGALRATIRSDPDVIMVGEIRDKDTAQIAIDAALTGHFLYSTLHTNDALSSVVRLEQLGIERFLIAEAVEVFVAQRLVRRLCQSCRQTMIASPEYLRGLRAPEAIINQSEKEPLTLYTAAPEGCAACSGIGYRGRTGVHEVVSINKELHDGIISGKSVEELQSIARKYGMTSLRDDCFLKVVEGVTSMEELARVVI